MAWWFREGFPFACSIKYAVPSDFDLQSFADPAGGGDLRFYDKDNEELAYEIDEWNASGESLVWVQVPDFARRVMSLLTGVTMLIRHQVDQNIWTDYEAVWHSSDATDSTGNGRDASTEGTISFDNGGLIGKNLSLSSGNLVINGYTGISGGEARTVSLWMKSVDSSGSIIGWGDNANHWDLSWDEQGGRVALGNGGVRKGNGSPLSGHWHHLLISYPGAGADLNKTRIYWDGVLVDLPASSLMDWLTLQV